MSKIRIGAIALAGVILTALVCLFAHIHARPKPVKFPDLAYFKSVPERELMSDEEFKYYTRALKNLDCGLANILLNTAFVRQYPQFQSARLKRQCDGDKGCIDWNIASGIIFKDYGYCKAVSAFNLGADIDKG